MSRNILIIAAHPDDEILGVGATMAKHKSHGDEVKVLILAEGITSRDNVRDTEKRSNELEELQKTALRANAILGVEDIVFTNFPDNRMDGVDRLDIEPTHKLKIDQKKITKL
jgi:LmbE family N-acetylglucosaminyl deacetylase